MTAKNKSSQFDLLQELARLHGIMLEYDDVFGRRKEASPATLRGLLRALGVHLDGDHQIPDALNERRRFLCDRGLEPVLVAWNGKPGVVDLIISVPDATGSATCMIDLETGTMRQRQQLQDLAKSGPITVGADQFVVLKFPLPEPLPWGYHPLVIETASRRFSSLIISAPTTAYWPIHEGHRNSTSAEQNMRNGRVWGCFLPLYAAHSSQDWGAGDFSELQRLIRWTANLGGSVIASLPLLASYLDDPCDPSPYAPVSRLFWNEFYVDPRQFPEVELAPQVQTILNSDAFNRSVAELRSAPLIDYRRLAAIKRQVLEALAHRFCVTKPDSFNLFTQFVESDPSVEDYAEFRATHEAQQSTWQDWPARLRDGDIRDSDYDERAKIYHCFAQWVASEQLSAIARDADRHNCGLYLDLPLGVRSDGYDVWRYREVFATGATAGAPPDAVWTNGQNWGFAPFHPDAIRDRGYRHVRDFLARQFRIAQYLRIDHVMGLHRLYWIPDGLSAQEGGYVQYRPEEWYAILCLESHRHETGIVGENLGTVPKEVNSAMRHHGVRQLCVVEYELESEHENILESNDGRCVASLNTHDCPTFAAWWKAEDLELRESLALMDTEERQHEAKRRERLKRTLIDQLQRAGWISSDEPSLAEITVAAHQFLAASDADIVIVNLEDLWHETLPQNVPGTSTERPNWRRRAELSFQQLEHHDIVLRILDFVQQLRQPDRRFGNQHP